MHKLSPLVPSAPSEESPLPSAIPPFATKFQPVAAVAPPKPLTPVVLVPHTEPVPSTTATFVAAAESSFEIQVLDAPVANPSANAVTGGSLDSHFQAFNPAAPRRRPYEHSVPRTRFMHNGRDARATRAGVRSAG